MARVAAHPIDPMFTARWSPRAMDGTPLSQAELMTLFEAARWAPSASNIQPWRFVYGVQGTPAFDALFAALRPGNQPWCKRAGALIVLATNTLLPDGKPSPTHSFDAGAAWMSIALQASKMGLAIHGMIGFDPEAAAKAVALPANHALQAMMAIGHLGKKEDLDEPYRGREAPNDRNPIANLVHEGRFPG